MQNLFIDHTRLGKVIEITKDVPQIEQRFAEFRRQVQRPAEAGFRFPKAPAILESGAKLLRVFAEAGRMARPAGKPLPLP